MIEAVPPALPAFHIPEIRWNWVFDMSSSAVSIAILGLLEALAISKAIAHHSRQKLDYNRQCLAEGVGNLVGGFFRCMPGAGSLSRTAINYSAGAETRASSVFTAVVVAFVVLLLGPLAAFIPKAALAGLLIVAAARLIDLERIRYTATASKSDAFFLLATALSALAIGVEFAILIGAALSIAWYVLHAAQLKVQELVVAPEQVVRARIDSDPVSNGVQIYDIEGELFFGAAPDLSDFLSKALDDAKRQGVTQLVLRVKRVRNPDAVALEVFDVFLRDAQREGVTVKLAGVRPDLLAALTRAGITERIGKEQIFPEEERDYSATLTAVRRAYSSVSPATAAEPQKPANYYLV